MRICGHAVERPVLAVPRVEVRIGNAGVAELPARCGLVEIHPPRRVGEWQRSEVNAVDEAEDEGVAGDAEAEDHPGQQHESRVAGQLAERTL